MLFNTNTSGMVDSQQTLLDEYLYQTDLKEYHIDSDCLLSWVLGRIIKKPLIIYVPKSLGIEEYSIQLKSRDTITFLTIQVVVVEEDFKSFVEADCSELHSVYYKNEELFTVSPIFYYM